MSSIKNIYPWAWNLLLASTESDISAMKIKGTEQREKLKSEIMGYIVCQSEGYITEEDQEKAADEILQEFTNIEEKTQ